MQVQAMWLYLEAVFTSGDIASSCRRVERFNTIDKNWEDHGQAVETRNVVQYCFNNDVLHNRSHLLEQLEVSRRR